MNTSFFTKDLDSSNLETHNPSIDHQRDAMQKSFDKQEIKEKFIKGLFAKRKSKTSKNIEENTNIHSQKTFGWEREVSESEKVSNSPA